MTNDFDTRTSHRYIHIADLMRQRIARGHWRPGDRLSSLEAMMVEFGVSRETVRQAIALLAQEGVLSPQQGRGTFVTGTPERGQWIKVETSLQTLAKSYETTSAQLISMDENVAHAPIRAGEGTAADQYVYMRRVHSMDGRPYCVINIYLDRNIYLQSPERFRNHTVISVLADSKRQIVASARQTLTVGSADLEVAKYLSIPPNSPVAEVRRVFLDEHTRVIYLGEVTYRGDSIRLEMDLKP